MQWTQAIKFLTWAGVLLTFSSCSGHVRVRYCSQSLPGDVLCDRDLQWCCCKWYAEGNWLMHHCTSSADVKVCTKLSVHCLPVNVTETYACWQIFFKSKGSVCGIFCFSFVNLGVTFKTKLIQLIYLSVQEAACKKAISLNLIKHWRILWWFIKCLYCYSIVVMTFAIWNIISHTKWKKAVIC